MSRIVRKVKARVVPDARTVWRKWSARVTSLGAVIMGLMVIDPSTLLAVYNMMPSEVRGRLPESFANRVAFTLFGLSLLSQFIKQKDKTNGE